MISEFGVPSSLGMAHFGPAGRNQGDHSEREALRIDGDMLRDIKDEGFAGGIVFEWIDEWFKFTWNTVDFQVADRRQLWHDDLTNEQFFGMIAADPVREPAVSIAKSRGPVREVRASKDEGALRLQLRLNRSGAWRTHPLTIGLDTRPGGTGGLPNHPGVFPAADAALVVGPGHAQLFQAASWEPTRITYGIAAGDAWVHPSQIVNRNPLQVHEVDTRSLASARGKVVDVRLPWAMLGYADPSSVTLYVAHPGTRATTIKGGRVGIAVLSDGSPLLKTRGYAWKPWQRVSWRERKKAGFSQLASTMRKLGR
jgi:hypothetical protein